jgi:hypothetical protein
MSDRIARATGEQSEVGSMGYERESGAWDAYEATVVDIEIFDQHVTVGPRGVESDTVAQPNLGEAVYIVTAYNPSRSLTPDENSARQAELAARVFDLGVEAWPAVGRDRENVHSEPSFAIRGVDLDEARLLGIRFGQDAIFEWTRETWSVIPCGPGTGSVFRDGRLVERPWFPDLMHLEKAKEAGLSDDQARLFAEFGVAPTDVAGDPVDALPFLQAADHHGLDSAYVTYLLEQAEGDPDRAWELWSEEEDE